jgi:AmpD protein
VVDLVVIHNISLPPGVFGGGAIDALFMGQLDCAAHPYFAALAGVRVSAHFLIDRRGALTQYVSAQQRAWHAGQSSFAGRSGCNDFSLGVELEGTDEVPFAPVQYATLHTLLVVLAAAYPLRAVTGHADIAPGRKTDPGPFFDWEQVAAALPAGLRVSR